jgi:uncharacterized protein with PQ loop repeat
MELPKVTSKSSPSSFGITNILGLIFLIFGILLIILLIDFSLPIDLGKFQTIIEFVAAAGSIIGGLAMLFKKHEPEIKTK